MNLEEMRKQYLDLQEKIQKAEDKILEEQKKKYLSINIETEKDYTQSLKYFNSDTLSGHLPYELIEVLDWDEGGGYCPGDVETIIIFLCRKIKELEDANS